MGMEEFLDAATREPEPEKEEVFTVKEAAEFLRVTPNFIYKLVGEKKIPNHHLGAKVLFIKSELLEFLKEL